jgi:hypothetical protein
MQKYGKNNKNRKLSQLVLRINQVYQAGAK